MRRIAAFIFPVLAVLFLVGGCSKKDQEGPSEFSYKIGVNQYVQHPILDAVYEGLVERLATKEDIEVVFRNSNADAITCRMINEQFAKMRLNAIVALGTPAAQSAVQVAGDTPVVFGAITDPVGAKLAESMEKPGGNKTGTTNRWPFKKQVQLLHRLFPDAKKVGLVINPGEDNCMAGVRVFREELNVLGLAVIEKPASNTAEVPVATESLINRVDAFLITPGNAVYAALPSILRICDDHKIPVIGGDESAVAKGAVATLGYSNKDVGIATADVVLKVISGKNSPGDVPVAAPLKSRLFLNEAKAVAFGVATSEVKRAYQ